MSHFMGLKDGQEFQLVENNLKWFNKKVEFNNNLTGKIGYISKTSLPTPILFWHIRAIQTPNRPNMPKKYSTW